LIDKYQFAYDQHFKVALTKEQLIEKINNERQVFSRTRNDMITRHASEVAIVRRLCDMVLARVVQSYGEKQGEEYVLDIPIPRNPEGKVWVAKAEKTDIDTMRVTAKLIDVPVLGETKTVNRETISKKLQEETQK
jgi:hypothetical protein